VTTWELYRVFHEAEIKPAGRLTRGEHRRFQRVLAGYSELERLHFTIALRLSNLEPIDLVEMEAADVN
jgi:hypothetical protein